jgi:hypothetical protein
LALEDASERTLTLIHDTHGSGQEAILIDAHDSQRSLPLALGQPLHAARLAVTNAAREFFAHNA